MSLSVKSILFLLIVTISVSMGQNSDSLWNEYYKLKEDTSKMVFLNETMADFYRSSNEDSVFSIFKMAIAMADKKISSNKNISKQELLYCRFYKFTSLRYTGMLLYAQSNFAKASEYYNKAIQMKEELLSSCNTQKETEMVKKGLAAFHVNAGLADYYSGRYDQAVKNYLRSLRYHEELLASCQDTEPCSNLKKGISICYSNIGNVYKEQQFDEKALEYHFKALKLKQEIDDTRGIATCYNNIANIYTDEADYPKSLEFYEKSLKIYQSLEDKRGLSMVYSNMGIIYKNMGYYDKAIDLYLSSIKLKKEIDDKTGISNVYSNISSLYISKADSSEQNSVERRKHAIDAVYYGELALSMAYEINAIPYINEASRVLMKSYDLKGDYVKASENADIFISTRDSMFSEEKTKALNEMEARYENEKKQIFIDNLNKENTLKTIELAKSEEERKKQQFMIWSFSLGFIIVLCFSLLILRLFIHKKKANLLLATQNAEIEEKNSQLQNANHEISAQKEEIEVQRDMVIIQKDRIELQKNEITDSITYAKKIQEALMPSFEYARQILGEHFILFRPKDIVSGDFYWMTEIRGYRIVTVADCTGHGVPGAFMSLLGITLLNEIVRNPGEITAGKILDLLRDSIIDSLRQETQINERSSVTRLNVKDGMDMALCIIDTDKMEIQYAGANNPVYIINRDQQLSEFKPDKQPVSIYDNMTPYTNHIIKFNQGDCVYMFSDGYLDQFGGPNGKKFKNKGLKELLMKNSGLPMEEQKTAIEKNLENWMNTNDVSYRQIDDITILGMKV